MILIANIRVIFNEIIRKKLPSRELRVAKQAIEAL